MWGWGGGRECSPAIQYINGEGQGISALSKGVGVVANIESISIGKEIGAIL